MSLFEWLLPVLVSGTPSVPSIHDSDTNASDVDQSDVEIVDRSAVYEELGVRAPPSSPTLPPADSDDTLADSEFHSVPWLLSEAQPDVDTSALPSAPSMSLYHKKDVANFVKYLDSFPLSSQFAVCFQDELAAMQSQWLDENGCLLSPQDCAALNEAIKRIDFLSHSVSFLESVVPPGR
ncbi:hypothetical protein HDV03_001086 [Kappamyces sp. JEL0829]|nr:hypothetical protein HDV03_001086 [Kappamyces sp. JEL0829]KAJ3368617.1 hypothetical protein HDU91_000411 [Kappamyces sp. JEL0680]